MLDYLVGLFFFISGTSFFNFEVLSERIVSGENASIADVPYQLSLEYQMDGEYRHFCGASIIGTSWALTAAHCVYGMQKEDFRLRSGTDVMGEEGNIHYVEKIELHPEYDDKWLFNDIAVIKVSEHFENSDTAKPIYLAKTSPCVGKPAVISGWGSANNSLSSPKHLEKVEIHILDPNICIAVFLNGFKRGMLCAGDMEGKRDSCQGDSGGPLVSEGEQVGIVSFGKDCSLHNVPGVYTDVAYYRDWVTNITGDLEVAPTTILQTTIPWKKALFANVY